MHSYLKPIALAFAIHGRAALAGLPACPEEYDSSARYGYEAGDKVSVTPAGDRTGKIYQCQSWPNSGHCVKDVYSPVNTEKVCGGDVCWPLAWTFLGDCEPTDSAALEACPGEFEAGTAYKAGDKVSVILAGETYGKIYQCQSWPNSGHCVKEVYSPANTEKVCGGDICWPLAWTDEGACEPIHSAAIEERTDSPDMEACPEEFEAGNAYEEGDKVSVTLAGETYGKIYQCQSWPNSGHCVKEAYSPANTEKLCNGDVCWPLAWTYEGGCSGTITNNPTQSPVFQLLTKWEKAGCPDEYVPNNSEYKAGDVVSVATNSDNTYGVVWQCKDGLTTTWCQLEGYAPGTAHGELAWLNVGHCEGPLPVPSSEPSKSSKPSSQPSSMPSDMPSLKPSSQPSDKPSTEPSLDPSSEPSSLPSIHPSSKPSSLPSLQPSSEPSSLPSIHPSSEPSSLPSLVPSSEPSSLPSFDPSSEPSFLPTESTQPSSQPSLRPSYSNNPTSKPSLNPSHSTNPTSKPSLNPSSEPSSLPSIHPSSKPSSLPSIQPSSKPSSLPSFHPSSKPSSLPSFHPSSKPNSLPSFHPSSKPSSLPSFHPSSKPSSLPSFHPSSKPSSLPSIHPSSKPSSLPSLQPSSPPPAPTNAPTKAPTAPPSPAPTAQPTAQPTAPPSPAPTAQPPSCDQTNTGVLLNTGSPSAVACLAMPGGPKTFLSYITSFGANQNTSNNGSSKWDAGYSGRIGVTSVLADNDYFNGYGGVKFIAGDGSSDSLDWVVMDWGPDNNYDYDGRYQDDTRGRYFGGESRSSGGGAFKMREGRLFGYSPSQGWKLLYYLPLGDRTSTYSHRNANWWTSGSTTGSGFGKYSDYDTLDIAYIAFSVETARPSPAPTAQPTAPPSPAPTALLVKLGQDINGDDARDQSGRAVSISSDGKRVAIGAPYNGSNSGHVRVYEYDTRSPSDWVQLGQDMYGVAGDTFGHSVSLSSDGKRVAIGATGTDGNGVSSGQVRVYEYDTTSSGWNQLGEDIEGEAAYDESGFSVSLSSDGKRVAIGAPYNDGNGGESGQVRVYEYDTTSPLDWVQLGQDIYGEAAADISGVSVSLSSDGKRVAIGATLNDGNGSNSGQVRVYEYNTTSSGWNQLGQDIDGDDAYDYSGYSVSLSSDGKRVAIGAPKNDGNGRYSGQVRVYEYDTTSPLDWVQLGQDIYGEAAYDHSGWSVSLSSDGKRVAIGAPYNGGNGGYSGQVRVYEYDTTIPWVPWKQLGQDINGETVYDNSGWSVSLSSDGKRVAIGAPNYDDGNVDRNYNSGHVRVYELGVV